LVVAPAALILLHGYFRWSPVRSTTRPGRTDTGIAILSARRTVHHVRRS